MSYIEILLYNNFDSFAYPHTPRTAAPHILPERLDDDAENEAAEAQDALHNVFLPAPPNLTAVHLLLPIGNYKYRA